jgi:hypothetical protein
VNVGGPDAPNAEDTGIQLTFVRATKWGDGKVVEAKPIIEHFGASLNGNGQSHDGSEVPISWGFLGVGNKVQ